MNVAVLASGRGTDFQSIADHVSMGILRNVNLCSLICNHLDAPVIDRAKKAGVPVFLLEGVSGVAFDSSEAKERARTIFDQRCVFEIQNLKADLVVLAGFDQIISSIFVEAFKLKILNIHPAYDLLLFGGKNMVGKKVHEVVLKSGSNYSGCAIHYVTNDIDGGPVLLKRRVDISSDDTPQSLERKILEVEHLAYPEAIQLVADERVMFDRAGKKCYVDRFSDNWDIEWNSRQQRYILMERK